MAVYAVSQAGIDSLNKLSSDLRQAVAGIDEACNTLYNKIEGIESDLGIYKKDILDCIRNVIITNQQGKEGVTYLAGTSIPRLVAIIEEIISSCGSSDDGEQQPPQKKLVRRHR